MGLFLINISVDPPSWTPSVWCYLVHVTTRLHCSSHLCSCPCGRWLAWGQQPGASSGLWQCRYHTGAHCPPWTHHQFVLGPLTTERCLGGFRPLMLHWEHSQMSLLENRRGKYFIPSEPGAFRPYENGALGVERSVPQPKRAVLEIWICTASGHKSPWPHITSFPIKSLGLC